MRTIVCIDRTEAGVRMRRITIDHIAPGMKLAQNIICGDGGVLLARGVALTANYIDRLKELGIMSLYVDDDISQDIVIEDLVSEETRTAALQTVHTILENCRNDKKIDLSAAARIVNSIVDELSVQKHLMIDFSHLRLKNDYQFAHAVNVCVLAIALGIKLEYNELKLRDLGVGALLHDIGMVKIAEQIIIKPGKLTKAEYAEVRKHPWIGFDILRATEGINILSAHIALQHHERCNGNGYPRGLCGDEIHDFGQIVAIADVYDAMTSDHAYRAALPICEAVNILRGSCPTHFAPRLVNRFIDSIAIYPPGTIVALSNNEVGIVVDINAKQKARPVVRILLDSFRRQVAVYNEIDLTKETELYICEVLDESSFQAALSC